MMPAETRPNEARIDLSAVADNVAFLRRHIRSGTAIIASVKANAYGHGIVPVARRLADVGVEVLATGSFADAIAMRDAGIATPILMMGGALPSAVPEFLRHDLITTVHCQELADAVAGAAQCRSAVYVKVDCGFGRLGVPLRDAHRFVLDLARRPRIEIAGLYTHLPFADAEGLSFARARIERFGALVEALARDGLAIPITQARASAALLARVEDDCCTAVSPGALIYGLSPVEPGLASPTGLRPVLARISTRLIQVSPWAADRSPEFASRHAARVRSTTGVVPFGRVDGNRAPRPGQDAHMLIGGVKAPVLGVSLEHAVIDLSEVPQPAVEQEVVVLGESNGARIALEDVAHWQGVGVNDVLMSLNGRVPARIVG
jgi:alanine racemase